MNAIEPLLHQPAAQAVGWALLHFIWQGAVVGVFTSIALLALRRSAADVRYVVATIGMALMLTLPVVTGFQKWQVSRVSSHRDATAVGSSSLDVRTGQSSPNASAQASANPAPAGHDMFAAAPAVFAQLPRIATVSRVEPVLPMLFFAWLVGVSALSVRLFTGWWWIQRLRTHGVTPAGNSWQHMAARLARRLHISRTIALLESTLVEVPTVVGWIKPAVLLPASALAGLSPQQLEAILAHELAHVRRHDYVVNLLQTLVETLLFYHPAVWWLSRRIRAERENCCDDLAVSLCGDPVTYASALADLETLRGGTSLALAASGGSLLYRVRRLLGGPPSHAGRGPAWLAGSAAVMLILGIFLGADGLGQASPQKAAPASTSAIAAPQEVTKQAPPDRPVATALPPSSVDAIVASARALESAAKEQVETQPALQASTEALAVLRAQGELLRAQAAIASTEMNGAQAEALISQATAIASTAPALAALDANVSALTPAVASAVQSISSHQHDSSGTWIWSNNGEKLSVSYSGTFDFTDDDADVRQISAGGYLKISDQAWVGRHTVEIHERGGTLDRRYYVNGSERPYEPEGRQWLHENLPKFVRNTGIGADRRVARILKSGGPSAVMTEISRIDGSYVKRIYFSELFKQASLTPEQYRQAMAQAGREINSDYERATLLISLVDRLPADEASRAAYFDAATGISSDYELRRVYSTMLKRGPVSPAVLAGILEHSSTIQSDYEMSELLRQIVAQQPLDERTRPAFFKDASAVQSAYERHRILSAVVGNSATDGRTLADALNAAAEINSDYEAATFLVEVLKQHSVDETIRVPFFKVVGHIGSSYERGRVLQAVVRKPDVSKAALLATLQACGQMSSAYDRAQVLLLVASTHTLSGDLREAYIDAAEKLQGYEQGQVMTALVKSERRK
jgi:beta-lactamase regulating signal transducer with metallopeptidase domain